MTPAAFLTSFLQALADDGPVLALVILIFITGWRRVWIFSREMDRLERLLTDERVEFMGRLNEMREERDTWRRMSLLMQGQRGPTTPPPGPMEGDD